MAGRVLLMLMIGAVTACSHEAEPEEPVMSAEDCDAAKPVKHCRNYDGETTLHCQCQTPEEYHASLRDDNWKGAR